VATNDHFRAAQYGRMPISRRKSLISLRIFLLNLSSFCHFDALARVAAGSGGAFAQSYPHELWAVSDKAAQRRVVIGTV